MPEEFDLGKLNDEIALNEEGDFIVPQDIMMNLINHYENEIEELRSKLPETELDTFRSGITFRRRRKYCCIAHPEFTNEISDWHNYKEEFKEVAVVKCRAKFGLRAEIKNGHCCNHVPNVECD